MEYFAARRAEQALHSHFLGPMMLAQEGMISREGLAPANSPIELGSLGSALRAAFKAGLSAQGVAQFASEIAVLYQLSVPERILFRKLIERKVEEVLGSPETQHGSVVLSNDPPAHCVDTDRVRVTEFQLPENSEDRFSERVRWFFSELAEFQCCDCGFSNVYDPNLQSIMRVSQFVRVFPRDDSSHALARENLWGTIVSNLCSDVIAQKNCPGGVRRQDAGQFNLLLVDLLTMPIPSGSTLGMKVVLEAVEAPGNMLRAGVAAFPERERLLQALVKRGQSQEWERLDSENGDALSIKQWRDLARTWRESVLRKVFEQLRILDASEEIATLALSLFRESPCRSEVVHIALSALEGIRLPGQCLVSFQSIIRDEERRKRQEKTLSPENFERLSRLFKAAKSNLSIVDQLRVTFGRAIKKRVSHDLPSFRLV